MICTLSAGVFVPVCRLAEGHLQIWPNSLFFSQSHKCCPPTLHMTQRFDIIGAASRKALKSSAD